ncbi:MAG TPA: helix-turn-helix domain-containing protein [Syntrophales bacterium]|nr:helix-turn-helix domain-containing protein [Syntrophales bacterium]
MGKLLYRIDEVAQMISRSRSGVYELLKRGELIAHNPKPGRKGMRVTAESIDAFLAKHKIPTDEFNP